MKILLLSDHLSIHTRKWAISLAKEGNDILVFSLSKGSHEDYSGFKNLEVVSHNVTDNTFSSSIFSKFGYLSKLPKLKKVIKDFQPDILHAHYATSYGLLGALSAFHPFVLSVWGWDVYHFPNSFIPRQILKFNFRKADQILSTSEIMAAETAKYTKKNVLVTPFGIDTQLFKPMAIESLFRKESFVVGTIKTLEEKYGIDYLIESFALLKAEYPVADLKLLVVGKGSQDKTLKELCKKLNIEQDVVFAGSIAHNEVPRYLNMLNIYVALSTLDSESFGVAIVEASACEIPVVVSDVGGLPEVVSEGETGLIVKRKNAQLAFEALKRLYQDKGLREEMGKRGRERVLKKFEWGNSVKLMIEIYRKIAQHST